MSHPATSDFFYIRDLDALRGKLTRAERDHTTMGRAWASLKHRAQAAPDTHPWFVPFVALVTHDPADIAAAKRQIFNYISTFDGQEFGMGLHFHFWCFSFPHARWCLYFKWLDALGAWTNEERLQIQEALTLWQFNNFFSGMRMKTEPECVDNQSLSLCYSNALFGRLFGDSQEVGAIARRVSRDGFRRLPDMLGGFPPSGYSGEGSTYMDHVVGPAIPFVVELLEAQNGGDWFNRVLPPNGGSAASVLRMVACEWMPNGLTLPWDHYGYGFPVRSAIAYGAFRTGESFYFDLLEKAANWGFDASIGWGYDDIAWSLIWWPEDRPKSTGKMFSSWAEKEVGGAIVSDNGDLYLMQMWDESSPKMPIRAHVNPNAIVLAAYGSPLTIDGVATKENEDFNYADTWVDRGGMSFQAVRSNYGVGCAGAHNVLLVDGWEGMRADSLYHQGALEEFNADTGLLSADVTPIYQEKWPDTLCVRRRSRLCEQRFWLIEDLAAFTEPHRVTSRWFFRPDVISTENGILVETAEGVRLHLLPLLGPDEKEIKTILNYPDRLDFESRQVDFHQDNFVCRWLWLAFPAATRTEYADLTEGWRAVGDELADFTFEHALATFDQTGLDVSIAMPPFLVSDAPVIATWWYRKTFSVPESTGPTWIRLPRGLNQPRVWIDGREIDLKKRVKLAELMPLDIEIHHGPAREVEVVLKTKVGVRQYGDDSCNCFHGRAALMVAADAMPPLTAAYDNSLVHVTSGNESWTVPHALMTVEKSL